MLLFLINQIHVVVDAARVQSDCTSELLAPFCTCRPRRPIKSSESRFSDHLCDGGPAFWACVCYERWVIGRRNGRFLKIYRCVHARRETIDGGTIRAAVNILNIQQPSSVPPTPLFVGVFPQFWAECVSDGPGIDFFPGYFWKHLPSHTYCLPASKSQSCPGSSSRSFDLALHIFLVPGFSCFLCSLSLIFSCFPSFSHSAYCFDYVHLCLTFPHLLFLLEPNNLSHVLSWSLPSSVYRFDPWLSSPVPHTISLLLLFLLCPYRVYLFHILTFLFRTTHSYHSV